MLTKGLRHWLMLALLFAPALAVSTPRFVVYYNSDAAPLDALLGTPYTHVILSFVVPRPSAEDPLALETSSRLDPFWAVVPRLQAEGKAVLLSFGGGDVDAGRYAPLSGHERALAARLAALVEARGLDGIDIDFEASDSFHLTRAAGVPDGRAFLIALSRALRDHLPAPRYTLTHAPQPPYLDPGWHGGPYLDVLRDAGGGIDWISVQYYDNPGFDDPMDGASPTAYANLAAGTKDLRWTADRLVLGKPIYRADARSGHLAPDELIQQVVAPLRERWGDAFGGLMGWQFSTLTPDHRAWNTRVGAALLGPVRSPASTGTTAGR